MSSAISIRQLIQLVAQSTTTTIQWWMDPAGQLYSVPATSTHYQEAENIVGNDVDPDQASTHLLDLGWMMGNGPFSGQIRVRLKNFDDTSQNLIGDLAEKTGARMIVLDTLRGSVSIPTSDFFTIDPGQISSVKTWTRIYSQVMQQMDTSSDFEDVVLTGTIDFRRPTWSHVEIVQIDGQEFAAYNVPRGAEAGSVVEYQIVRNSEHARPFVNIVRVVSMSPDYALQALRRIGKVLSLWREWRLS